MVMGKGDIGQHTVQQYNEDLENLHRAVLDMGRLVLEQLEDGIAALEGNDKELATRVLRRDVEVNTLEVHLDKECQRILVRRQPAAGDLRLIFAVIKTVTDLERIGDQVGHVARAVLESDPGSPNRPHAALAHLASLVRTNCARTMESFASLDVALALQVAQADLEVNREYQGSMRQLLTYIMEDPRTTSSALQLAWTARALERIGDHAKNIAEYVIYMVHGEDVRHISDEERRQRLAPQSLAT
ncbi:MAG: phosphate signaling complex protein PhoU [Pseudomonadales bacterium]|jgi:phosphate transport system protein|nr:phosphate signaling complex protein PhoU [Pseudomonadales bacterium]